MGIFTFYAFCVHALTMRALLVQIKLDCIHSSIILQRNMWIIDCKCISTYLQFYLGRMQVHTYQCTMGFNPEKVQFIKATVYYFAFIMTHADLLQRLKSKFSLNPFSFFLPTIQGKSALLAIKQYNCSNYLPIWNALNHQYHCSLTIFVVLLWEEYSAKSSAGRAAVLPQ